MTTAAVPEQRGEDARAPAGTWLGFDFGLRRIGVASGQTATGTAGPLAVVAHGPQQPDWHHIRALLKEWRPVGLVVGLPLDKAGKDTPIAKRARAFGRRLEQESGIEVRFIDERLTSWAVDEQFASQRASGSARRKDAARLDAKAAAIILQNWLQSRHHEP